MRQRSGAELTFVTLSNGASSTTITINGSNLALGDYELVLESYDEANTVQSTLKTNRIVISVVNTAEEVEVVVEQGECIVNPENFLALAQEI